MPAIGPVYQPTTVTYEQQNDWTPISNWFQFPFPNGSIRTRFIQWALLILGLVALAAGLVMIIEGSVDLYDTKQHDTEVGETPNSDAESAGDIVIVIVGVIVVLLCILSFGLYARMIWRTKGCPCFPSKEQRLARQLDNQVGNGQILTLNPSTDLLVTAQYAPVSEVSYHPPTVSEEEETRKLMGSDNKECVEESERMLESDPRIVLRPRSHVEEA
ncbi:uncharacterized protein LOC111873324 isoform X2 [Cryptotermes secundus]|uniref:uncharacterized protein LOC111873324 isoform X2 n=1 Tax=Cryptotermes secundus TaxID=105785 RepID=UPI000CD7D7DC|nr:uncharacterized protein LOC111873324 isoform X2 [Cryptotermes secundus]